MLAVGFAVVLKTEWIIQNVGTNDWAEMKMGTFGGSRMMYKLLGLVLIFLGFLIAFDMSDALMNATFGRLVIK